MILNIISYYTYIVRYKDMKKKTKQNTEFEVTLSLS